MQEKFNALNLGEKLILGGALLMLIAALFFDWWSYDTEFGSFGYSGFGAPGDIWSILAVLVSLVMAGIIAATKLGNMAAPNLPQNMTWGLLFGGGAALVVLLMLLKAWRIADVPAGGFGIGFFIGAIATLVIAYGGWLLYSEEKKGVMPA